jgi:hypothetical protein
LNKKFLRNVLIKGLALFLVIDLAFIWVSPAFLGKLSLYNKLFPGRLRFPFGENQAQAYNLSLFNLDAMFAAHTLAGTPKPPNEYRVFVIGDSSIWGTLLRPEQTLAGLLDADRLNACGKVLRVYNLGYPTTALTKDLMILDYAMRYEPDLIIWSITLDAFPVDAQLSSSIVSYNADRVAGLNQKYSLPFNVNDPALVHPNLWERTLIGQRRDLADLFRLQMYGVLWSATGIDQIYPDQYVHAQTDLSAETSYHGMQPPDLDMSRLAFNVLEAGLQAAGQVPVLLVNEPILISPGKNSDIRYDFYYPRWAYDQWRQIMGEKAAEQGWNYTDLWNLVPADQFSNSAIHPMPEGEKILAKSIEESLLELHCP